MPTTTYHNTRDPSRTLWCPQIHRKYTFLSLTLHHHLRCVERRILVSKTFLLETLTYLNYNLTQHLWPLSHTLLPSSPSEIHCFSHAGHNPLQKEHNQIWCWWSCALTRTCQSTTEEVSYTIHIAHLLTCIYQVSVTLEDFNSTPSFVDLWFSHLALDSSKLFVIFVKTFF